MIFDVISRILMRRAVAGRVELVAGRLCIFSDMRNFSKIDFFDSLTVGLSSNFDIWFITCYFMV